MKARRSPLPVEVINSSFDDFEKVIERIATPYEQNMAKEMIDEVKSKNQYNKIIELNEKSESKPDDIKIDDRKKIKLDQIKEEIKQRLNNIRSDIKQNPDKAAVELSRIMIMAENNGLANEFMNSFADIASEVIKVNVQALNNLSQEQRNVIEEEQRKKARDLSKSLNGTVDKLMQGGKLDDEDHKLFKAFADNPYALDEIEKKKEKNHQKHKDVLDKHHNGEELTDEEQRRLHKHKNKHTKIEIKEVAVKARLEGEEIHKDTHEEIKEAKIREHVENRLDEKFASISKNFNKLSIPKKLSIQDKSSEIGTNSNLLKEATGIGAKLKDAKLELSKENSIDLAKSNTVPSVKKDKSKSRE